MYYSLANFVMIVHAVMVVAVLAGILISLLYKTFRPMESMFLLVVVVLWSLYEGCPLTFLENNLRVLGEKPLPLLENGFIPFYVNEWFGIPITNYQITVATYITATLFFLISIEWFSPYINFEIIKLRKAFVKFKKKK